MSAKRALAGAVLIAFTLAASESRSQSASEPLTDPTPFEIGYGMSFVQYDLCGDAEAGRLFRQAVVERFEQCPFTPEAQASFQSWRIETLEHLVGELFQMIDTGQRPDPANRGELNPDGTPMSCPDHRKTPRYVARRADIVRYGHGEIRADELISDPCDVSPGAP